MGTNMKKRISVIIISILMMTVLSSCTEKVNQTMESSIIDTADSKISIITTTFPSFDFARVVAGDYADIKMLIKPGAEVHSFEPTPADIIAIENADLFIYIGGESEAWVEELLESAEIEEVKTLRLMDCVDTVDEELAEGMMSDAEPEETHEAEEETENDEHIWTSPKNAILLVEAVGKAIRGIDPDNSDIYLNNEADYIVQIEAIDKEIQEIVDNAKRDILVFGDRYPFRYLSDAYNLSYRAAFSGCSSDTEADAATMAYLINLITENDIPCIFYIELSNQKVAQAISEQTGAEMLLLHSCQNVTKDEFEAGATYVSIMSHNAENLRKGLN